MFFSFSSRTHRANLFPLILMMRVPLPLFKFLMPGLFSRRIRAAFLVAYCPCVLLRIGPQGISHHVCLLPLNPPIERVIRCFARSRNSVCFFKCILTPTSGMFPLGLPPPVVRSILIIFRPPLESLLLDLFELPFYPRFLIAIASLDRFFITRRHETGFPYGRFPPSLVTTT